jgi:hypothetical protein
MRTSTVAAALLFPDRFRLFPVRSGGSQAGHGFRGSHAEGRRGRSKGKIDMDMNLLRETLGPLLSRKQAARYLTERGLETAPQTLGRKFCEGTGPLCSSLNRRAMYYRKHLDDWFNEQLAAPRRSSSAPRQAARTQRGATSGV